MAKPTIPTLGKRLDEAERALSNPAPGQFGALCHARHAARLLYCRELAARHRAACDKFRNRKTPIRSRDAFALKDKMLTAMVRLDEIEEARPEFATERELIDANAESALRISIWEIAQARYRADERQALADRAAGINRS